MGNHNAVQHVDDLYEQVHGTKMKNEESRHDEEGVTFGRLFKRVKVLGEGAFGKVILAEDIKTKQQYAVKILHKLKILQKKSIRSVKKEQSLLMGMNHPFIIKLRYTLQDEYRIYFVMDYIKGGDMEHLFKSVKSKFPVSWVKNYIAELLCALRFLHQHGIIHRDVKMSNILISEEGHTVLTDFGLSTYFDLEPKSLCGTYKYISPEMLDGVGVKKALRKGYSFNVDFWALGILMFKMLYGKAPFQGNNPQTLFYNIMFDELTIPNVPENSVANDLLAKLLKKKEAERIGYNGGANEIMKHKFFEGIDFDKMEKLKLESPIKKKGLKIKANIKKKRKDKELYSPVVPEMSVFTKKFLKENQGMFQEFHFNGKNVEK